jgi:hypothetical protein
MWKQKALNTYCRKEKVPNSDFQTWSYDVAILKPLYSLITIFIVLVEEAFQIMFNYNVWALLVLFLIWQIILN